MLATKKKRVSKKNKSSWRKNIDIKDVEEFLDNKREHERLVGNLVEKSNEELFTFDIQDDEKKITDGLLLKQKRKLDALKPQKYKFMENTSKVECPIKINKKSTNEDTLKEKLSLKQKKLIKAIEKNKIKKKLNKKIKNLFVKNIWDENEENKNFLTKNKSEWISRELVLHHLRGTGNELVKVPETFYQKTTLAKAFDPPHPGLSYNPKFEDHQNLLDSVVDKEIKIIKENEHLDRVTTKMFSKVPMEERDKIIEESLIDNDDDDNNNSELEISTLKESIKNKKTLNKKKKKSKLKQERVKKQTELQSQKKERKKQITDLHRLKKIVEDVDKEQEKAYETKTRKRIKNELKKFEPKRLCKLKYKEPDVDILEPHEMPENLRSIKCTTKLIVEKFKDFQRRNILPVSVDVGPRKPTKKKRFVRKSHKDAVL